MSLSLPEKCKGKTATRAKRKRLKINKLINNNSKYHHYPRAPDLTLIPALHENCQEEFMINLRRCRNGDVRQFRVNS